jgi:hypothetical protein
MPSKYTPIPDQSIIFLPTDNIDAATYNQNIKSPDVKLEHFLSFLDRTNVNGLNATYNNAQGLSYQNIAPSSLGTNKIDYSINYINSTNSAKAITVGATYTSTAIPLIGLTDGVIRLNPNLKLLGYLKLDTPGYPGRYDLNFVLTLTYTIRVLESNTLGGTYTPIFTKTETKKIHQVVNFDNLSILTLPCVSNNKFIKLELTINEGSSLSNSVPNPDLAGGSAQFSTTMAGTAWDLTLSFDSSSTYQIQKSFA